LTGFFAEAGAEDGGLSCSMMKVRGAPKESEAMTLRERKRGCQEEVANDDTGELDEPILSIISVITYVHSKEGQKSDLRGSGMRSLW